MKSSSGVKLGLKNTQNHQKIDDSILAMSCKLASKFSFYICCFCSQDICVLKISGRFDQKPPKRPKMLKKWTVKNFSIIISVLVCYIWDKLFKNGPSKICRRQPLKYLKGYGLLSSLPKILLGPF